MQVNVRTHHVAITKALKEYSIKKMEKLGKYFDNIQQIQIELDILSTSDEKKRQVAKSIVSLSGSLIRAQVASADMYSSIDLLYEKLEQQIRKYKEKMKARKNKVSALKRVFTAPLNKLKKKTPIKIDESYKYFLNKPISVEEAEETLKVEHLPFLVFRNAETEVINVIYDLGKNKKGLIET